MENRDYLYENIDYYDDVMPGQRGFGKNMDRLCNQLINFYHQKFKLQADETMKKIAKINEQLDKTDIETLKRNAFSKEEKQ